MSMYDTTPAEQKMWEGVQALSAPDEDLRGAFARDGDDRAEYKAELAVRAKALRSVIRKAEVQARRMDIISGLM